MTGGTVVVLGSVGDNFGAGMTGGMAIFSMKTDVRKAVMTNIVILARFALRDYEQDCLDFGPPTCGGDRLRIFTNIAREWGHEARQILADHSKGRLDRLEVPARGCGVTGGAAASRQYLADLTGAPLGSRMDRAATRSTVNLHIAWPSIGNTVIQTLRSLCHIRTVQDAFHHPAFEDRGGRLVMGAPSSTQTGDGRRMPRINQREQSQSGVQSGLATVGTGPGHVPVPPSVSGPHLGAPSSLRIPVCAQPPLASHRIRVAFP